MFDFHQRSNPRQWLTTCFFENIPYGFFDNIYNKVFGIRIIYTLVLYNSNYDCPCWVYQGQAVYRSEDNDKQGNKWQMKSETVKETLIIILT